MQSLNVKQICRYLYTKLIGAGFAFSLFILFIAFSNRFTLFDLSQTLESPFMWAAFYGYGIACSLFIDLIIKIGPSLYRWTIWFYLFAGFVLFIFLMSGMVYIIFAGSVGMLAALVFYFGVKFVPRNKWASITFAILLPVIMIIISQNDFTKKKDWRETLDETTFEANFTYFNGEHKIPLKLEKGDVLSYRIDFDSTGGYGNHFENEQGKYMPMDRNDDILVYTAKEDGEFYIVVSGTNAAGKFEVDWDIRDDKK